VDGGRQDPRANQKARTRAAIVEAAQRLRGDAGETPTVAEAASAAGVSRATAYRYFPTQEALEVEVADVTPDVAATEEALARLETSDVEERLLALIDAFGPVMVAKEAHFRRALWVYQDTWLRGRRRGDQDPVVREGRRMRWLDVVLEPLDTLSDERRERLRAALALTLGGDALAVMKDVCRLDDDEALEVLRWAAVALLRAELAGPDGAGS
jgi:AcrR family transcriptional regulator